MIRLLCTMLLGALLFSPLSSALAEPTPKEILGTPEKIFEPIYGKMGMQESGSPIKRQMDDFNDLLLPIIFGIVIFVLVLLVVVAIRFNKSANPNPSKTTHNTFIEIIWTAVPVLILVVIAIPSFKLLFAVDEVIEPDIVVKVTGHQWYWNYEYPDYGDVSFDSIMIPDEEIDESKGQRRLLSVDEPLVLPTNKNIKFLITAGDVLHAFAMPALGLKMDAMPGRLNETQTFIEKEGLYYGQCSEICGSGHAYMPIEIRAVSQEKFEAWVKAKGGKLPTPKQAAIANDNKDTAVE